MPLVGFVDPSHYERRHTRPGRLPQWVTVEQMLENLMEPNPKYSPWVYELALAVISEHQERGTRISTSLLTGACPRSSVLERMEDWVSTLDDNYASLRGTLIHRTLEAYARPGSIPEARFYTTIDGIELSCSPDLLTVDTLYDYKTTETQPAYNYPYRNHTEQVQFNAYICRHAEKWEAADGSKIELPFDPRENPARHAVVVYLGPKGPKQLQTEKKQEFTTPTGATVDGDRPYMWSDEEVLEVLRPRLHAMVAAFEGYPEFPAGAEEVWGGPAGWKCIGAPLCNLPSCLARRDPDMFVWSNKCKACHGTGKRNRGECKACGGSGG
jgi:hypothetical protein